MPDETPPNSNTPPASRPVIPLKVTPQELVALQTKLWGQTRLPPEGIERRKLWVRFVSQKVLLATDDGVLITVMPINLSIWGIGFASPISVVQTAKLTMRLTERNGSGINLRGVVARCQRLDNNLFLVSMRFEQPLDITRLTKLEEDDQLTIAGELHEVDAVRRSQASLPKVFIFNNDVNRRRMMVFRLKELKWEFIEIESRSQIHQRLEEAPDALGVLVAFEPDPADASYAVRVVRQHGYKNWVIGLGKDDSEHVKGMAERAGCNHYLGGFWSLDELKALVESFGQKGDVA